MPPSGGQMSRGMPFYGMESQQNIPQTSGASGTQYLLANLSKDIILMLLVLKVLWDIHIFNLIRVKYQQHP
jgi:hypothetical protein